MRPISVRLQTFPHAVQPGFSLPRGTKGSAAKAVFRERTTSVVPLKGTNSWALAPEVSLLSTGPIHELVDVPVQDLSDLADFVREDSELFGKDRLHAVRKGFVRLMVNFNEQTIGADGDRRP